MSNPPEYSSEAYVGATLTTEVRFYDPDDTPTFVSTDVILIRFEKPDGTKFTKAGTKGSTDGEVVCNFVAGDLSVAGEYQYDVKVSFNSGIVLTTANKQKFIVR